VCGVGNNRGTLRLKRVKVMGNSAYSGGCVAPWDALTMIDSIVSGNQANAPGFSNGRGLFEKDRKKPIESY